MGEPSARGPTLWPGAVNSALKRGDSKLRDGRRSKNYLALSGAQSLSKDKHLISCDFAPCEARLTSTLRHTVLSGTCNAQQQSEHDLLLACGRDDGSRDDWIPLLAFGAAAGASALPAVLLRLSKVSAAAEGAQLRQASHGCGCTSGSVAWGHQLQQSWQLHVPATTMLQQLQQGLHWGIGDGAVKLGLSCREQRRGGAMPFEPAHDALPNHCHHAEPEQQAVVLEQPAKGDSPWWRPTLLPLKQL
ncbi:hypothetical protein HaLaN_10192 [Haematococcus lacustris]|uniref:Uncharacterized protein n=1 Tax=Haematococcus lacustris TaxID=44745 RepID=A0A699YY87_HAELA|nr:hypothetical protein HaLaN_10192 [Haematococcus lacustris]